MHITRSGGFEASPLNRVLKQGAPGLAWQPNADPTIDHSVKLGYGTNSTGDAVMLWTVDTNGTPTGTTTYPVNSLYKTTTWDENNNQTSGSASHTEEFKDMQGKVVLKRSFNGTVALSTYYVYDDMELLRFVLPPKAMEDNAITGTELNDLCYQYRYDERKRMTMKKIPGAESILLVYDNRDRLVMSQDGTSRAAGKWQFTKYDYLNRPVMTGYFSPGQTEEQLRSAFKGYTGTMYETAQEYGNTGYSLDNSYPSGLAISENNILSITYYDNYSFLGVTGFSPYVYTASYDIDTYIDNDGYIDWYFDYVKGQVTGTKMKVLDGNEFTTSAKWLYGASYYDDRYRVIQRRRTLYDGSSGGVETLANRYDFTGRVTQSELAQTFNGVTTMVDKYLTYDSQGRLTTTEQQITGDANGRVTVAENVYNETGQLVTKKLHKVGSSYLQNVDYTYNIRGWLKSINDPDNLSGDLFAERLLYESTESGLNSSYPAKYNGNISAMVWNSDQKSKQGYGFTYDGLNRLTLGDYKYYSGGWNDNNNYEEKSLAYDLNGNINRLQRTDNSGGYNADFTYAYSGNQLSNINSGTSYTYDQNGNTTTDGLRGMAISYNVLNLPNSITKSSDNISYIYSAAGEKLAKKKTNNTYQYYAGNMIYNNDKTLNYILFEEGMVNKSSGAFTYEYHLKDHLGNTRVTFQPNGGSTTTTQVAEYYPFGSSYLPLSPAGTNKYLYNGKEKQDDVLSSTALDWYDYKYRFYDPQICRFNSIDRLASEYPYKSPYDYAENRPVSGVDLDGLEYADANYCFWAASNPLGAVADGFRPVFQSWSSLLSFDASATATTQATTTVSGSSVTSGSSSVITENKATFSFMPQNMFNYTGDNNVPSPFSTSTTKTTKTEQKVTTSVPVVGKVVNLSVATSQDTKGTQKATVEAGVGLTNKSSTAAATAYGQVVNTTTSNGNSTTSAKVGAKVTVPIGTTTTSTSTTTTAVGVKVELEKKLIGN